MRMSLAAVLAHEARLKAGKANGSPPNEGVEYEAKLHEQIIEACQQRGWYFVRSRMDRPTTQQKGVPDFIIAAHGKTYWVEAKAKGKKLTREQNGTLHWLQHLGHPAGMVYSLADFLALIEPNNEVSGGMDASAPAKG